MRDRDGEAWGNGLGPACAVSDYPHTGSWTRAWSEMKISSTSSRALRTLDASSSCVPRYPRQILPFRLAQQPVRLSRLQ